MARLRKPSPTDHAIFIPPPPTTHPTRCSPRKNVRESHSTRKLRYTSSQDSDEDSFLVPKAPVSQSPVRKQRVLRPMASNASLALKPSNDSLREIAATPDRDRSSRRGLREGGSAANYLYSRTLARSVARKKGPWDIGRRADAEETVMVAEDVDVETSIVCGDEEGGVEEDKENAVPAEESEEDVDEEPVVHTGVRRQQPRARPVLSDSGEDDDDDEFEDAESHHEQDPVIEPPQSPSKMMQPPPLVSSRPPHQKGHSTISHWAQGVIDLTSSPELPESFVLPPPARARTASFAASSGASSRASNRVDDILV